mgnify:CR=1 FL=1
MTTYVTQRAEDRAAGLPLNRSMTEDPKKRGIPLFLQAQNTRTTHEQWEAWVARLATRGEAVPLFHASSPRGSPELLSVSGRDLDMLEAQCVAEKKVKTHARFVTMKNKVEPPATTLLDWRPRSDSKRRVCLYADLDKQGTVMSEGPEQSVVKWDNGNESVVVNDWVGPIQHTALALAAPPVSKSERRATRRGQSRELGYKGHAVGSRVAQIHECYDQRGMDAALALGKVLAYNEGTIRRLALKW